MISKDILLIKAILDKTFTTLEGNLPSSPTYPNSFKEWMPFDDQYSWAATFKTGDTVVPDLGPTDLTKLGIASTEVSAISSLFDVPLSSTGFTYRIVLGPGFTKVILEIGISLSFLATNLDEPISDNDISSTLPNVFVP